MQVPTSAASGPEVSRLILPLGLAAVLVAAWVALTIQTGLTYHLAPGLIAALPGYVLGWSMGRPPSRRILVLVALAGPAFVAAGWTILELAGSLPAATFIEDQPGGVRGEMAAFALLGTLLSVRAMLHARRDEDSDGLAQ